MVTIKNKKVVDFYTQHPNFDVEEMNILLVDFLRNLLPQLPNEQMDPYSISNLLQTLTTKCEGMESSLHDIHRQQNQFESRFTDSHKQMIDAVALQIFSTKDTYIKELEKFVQSGRNDEIEQQQKIANQNLEKTLDKIKLFFGDEFSKSFASQISRFNDDINNEIKKALNTETRDNTLTEFKISLNTKYDALHNIIMKINDDFKHEITNINCKEDMNSIRHHFERQKNSSNKGADGENKLESILNQLFPTADVQNTTGMSKSGDFIVNQPDKHPIMFENKDYANNVPICEVEKFIRDIDNLNMHGIFLSQNSGISRKDDFHIDIYNNKIIIFVHHVNYSVDKIKVAISMLGHLIVKIEQIGTTGDVVSESVLHDINKEFRFFLQQRNTLMDLVKKFNKDMQKQISDLEFPELNRLLANKFATTEIVPFTCKFCSGTYKNAKALAAHVKKCKEKEKHEQVTT